MTEAEEKNVEAEAAEPHAGEAEVAATIDELAAEKAAVKPREPEAVATITITVFDNETARYQVAGPLDSYAVIRVLEALINAARQQPLFPKAAKSPEQE